jgi:hypothetical protein
MRICRGLVWSFLLCLFGGTGAVSAQLPTVKTDPLHPTQIIQGTGACSATGPSSCAQAAAKITPVVMGESPLAENLRRLTDEIGGRVSGSAEYAKAVQWGVAGFRAAGVDVHTEKFMLPVAWSEGASRMELSGPELFPVAFVSGGLSPATAEGGIEAPLVNVGYGTEAEFAKAGAVVKGAILIVNSDIGSTWADLFNEYLRPPSIIERAIHGGAVAILWTGERERKLLYRHTNTSDGKAEKIPQAVLAREDALRLQRAIDTYPGRMRARLTLPNKISGPVEQENVIGEIRGYEKPDEIVVLAAHLDSWELGTGALDNGCNAALVIEAARAIKASGLLPRRTIRFILFGGEEQGMIGSFGYARAHRAEMDKYRGVIVFDTGTGRVTGFSLGGNSETICGMGCEPQHHRRRDRNGPLRLYVGRSTHTGGQPGDRQLFVQLPCRVGHLRQGEYPRIEIEHGAGGGDGVGHRGSGRADRKAAESRGAGGDAQANWPRRTDEDRRLVGKLAERSAGKTAVGALAGKSVGCIY